jgi:hypothetical protein
VELVTPVQGKQAAGPVDQAFELAKSAMAALTRKE